MNIADGYRWVADGDLAYVARDTPDPDATGGRYTRCQHVIVQDDGTLGWAFHEQGGTLAFLPIQRLAEAFRFAEATKWLSRTDMPEDF